MGNLSLSVRNVLSTKTLNHTGMFGKVYAGQKGQRKNTWSYCWEKRHWEELECFTDVGNTFPVEIKFGDKWVRRGPAHLSITRLYKKCPPLLFSREIQRWDLSKAITSCNSSIFRKARNQSVTNIFEYSNIWIYFYRVFIWTFLCIYLLYKYIHTLVHECVRVWKLFEYSNVFKYSYSFA